MSASTALPAKGVAALRAFARSATGASIERCDVCAAGIEAGHHHLLSKNGFDLRCACKACALAPPPDALVVAPKLQRLKALPSSATWAALGVPVSLAFFVRTSDESSALALVARYPGPAGATAAEIDPESAARLVGELPDVASILPQIEAILIDRRRGVAYRTSIDWCFELVGLLRGRRDDALVDAFFAKLAREAADG